MKKKALVMVLFAGIVLATSCADDVLNVCTICTESTTGDEQEFCGTVVQVETFETSMEANDYECARK